MAKGDGKGRNGALECCVISFWCLIVLMVMALAGLSIAKEVLGKAVCTYTTAAYRVQRLVPIWLIVSGILPIFLSGCKSQHDYDSYSRTVGVISGLIGFVFNIIWLICGTYWVYPTYAKVHSNSYFPCVNTPVPGCSASTCPQVLVDFAFAMVIIDWVLVLLGIVVCLFNVHQFCKTQAA